jgi:hypothetical protein
MNPMRLIVGVVVLLIIIMTYKLLIRPMVWPWAPTSAESSLGSSRPWNVLDSYKNKRAAAELLARVNGKMMIFMRYMKKKYHLDEPLDIALAEGDAHIRMINTPNNLYNMADHLLNNYSPEVFCENDPKYSNDTSYTLNKGDAIYVCLRDRSHPNRLVKENDLLFVLLHEVAHIANYDGWGHDEKFWAVFKWILHEAGLSGIYQPIDYYVYPTRYCGLNIGYSPLFDNGVRDLWL